MNVRLTAIQEQAAAAGVHAARVAMLSPSGQAETALALGRRASGLSAWAAASASLGECDGPDRQFVAGQITARPDFTEFDELTSAFLHQVASGRAALRPAADRVGHARVSQPAQ
jgi:hypothetical protein